MHASAVPANTPHRALTLAEADSTWADGGSCIAGPDGEWVVERGWNAGPSRVMRPSGAETATAAPAHLRRT